MQASRWTVIKNGGFIHSFNGPHSLFVDTIRSCRALVVSHCLGHVFQGEGDVKIDLLERAIQHLKATANYSVFYGEGVIVMMYGDARHMKVFLMRKMEISVVPIHNKVFQVLQHGQEDLPGPCVVLLKNWNGLIQ